MKVFELILLMICLINNIRYKDNYNKHNIINTHTYYDGPISMNRLYTNFDKENPYFNYFQYSNANGYQVPINNYDMYEDPENNYHRKEAIYVSSTVMQHHDKNQEIHKNNNIGYPVKPTYNSNVHYPFGSMLYNNPFKEHYYLANFNPNIVTGNLLMKNIDSKLGISRRLSIKNTLNKIYN